MQHHIIYIPCVGLQEGQPNHNFHNKLRDGITDLAGNAFTLSHVRDDHLIHPVCTVQERKAQPKGSLPKYPPVEK